MNILPLGYERYQSYVIKSEFPDGIYCGKIIKH